LQGSDNGRVVTIDTEELFLLCLMIHCKQNSLLTRIDRIVVQCRYDLIYIMIWKPSVHCRLIVIYIFSGDRILNGESKLSLTTQSLSLLNVSFRRYSESKYGESSRNKQHQEQLQKWKFNVQYLHDFITKTISLKVWTKSQIYTVVPV
jgi:hypothetical protein